MQKGLASELRLFYALSFFSNTSADLAIWSLYFIYYCGFSLSQAAVLHALIFAVIAFSDLPTSTWADRFGRKLLYQIAHGLRFTGAIISVIFPSFTGIAVAAVLTGVGWALSSGTWEALLFDNLKAVNQEGKFANSFSNALSFQFAGRTLTFCAAGLLFEINPTYPYMLLAFGMIVSLIILNFLTERHYQKTSSKLLSQSVESFAQLFRTKELIIFVVAITLIETASNGLTWMSLQPLLTFHGLSPSEVGMGYAVGGFGSLIGSHYAKRVTVETKHFFGYVLFSLFFITGNMIFAFCSEQIYLLGGFFVISIGFGFSWPLRSSLLNPALPSSHRATCLSIFSSVIYLMTWCTGSFVGVISDYWGVTAIPAISSLAIIVSLPLLYGVVSKLPRDSD